MSLEEGSRRPLGAGSGSLAILAFLAGDERGDAIRHCAPLYEPFGLSAAVVERDVAEARKVGFAFNPGRIIEGVYGIGVPILEGGRAVASVSVAAIAGRMAPPRRQEIVGIIREELASLSGYAVPNAQPPASARSKAKVA